MLYQQVSQGFLKNMDKYFERLLKGWKGINEIQDQCQTRGSLRPKSNRFEQHPSIALQGRLNKVWDLDDNFKWFFHKIFKYQLNKIYLHTHIYIYIYIYYICLKTHLFTFWNAKLLIKLIHLGFVNIFVTIDS